MRSTFHGCLILYKLSVFQDIIVSRNAKGVCWKNHLIKNLSGQYPYTKVHRIRWGKNHLKKNKSEWVISIDSFSGTAVGIIDLITWNEKSPRFSCYQQSAGGDTGMLCLWGPLLQPLGARAVPWSWHMWHRWAQGSAHLAAANLPLSPCLLCPKLCNIKPRYIGFAAKGLSSL